jgi:hypothetical protein
MKISEPFARLVRVTALAICSKLLLPLPAIPNAITILLSQTSTVCDSPLSQQTTPHTNIKQISAVVVLECGNWSAT